ncbi:hypothetical protein ASPWEDRAFT_104655 [Aspergillus wentii DTO 134E9]|uniref:Uncharacterized protein n=1 Tax=Aspergillus wentii DTO 134E9 TaxID=1073089 RepID=A0A1L9RUK0_ASPWE|nr:uncharacterized protein ASPWEDRAFT_104655 [Aspergillus wentii DTO 134E9]KAI9928538.1 hypothetical protein MW887_001752 [Aspergillus wentii]OJJ38612.1 hypothetical protein ASPWEDRAFT_104655 [Aspergillus wentii DTO 134E9]
MSEESNPIPPSLFAEAIKELPLSTIYAKVSELRNSIAHLHRSNDELRTFVTESCDTEDDKRELEGYITENEGVITSMRERITLLKAEVEGRGQQWIEVEDSNNNNNSTDTNASSGENQTPSSVVVNGAENQGSRDTGADEGQDGVYL